MIIPIVAIGEKPGFYKDMEKQRRGGIGGDFTLFCLTLASQKLLALLQGFDRNHTTFYCLNPKIIASQ
ncbi:hypothetical protein BI308_22410 [Roseofilum reptotaenium AO1-A]|uniref:Uncharacterized protein n=1 Tax=Roseofilum reptotaenium AO1-A TaxID=1925591 RepID=A0A1L9QKZ0_9CYAN|nr:hypothetical protein BI308_22410 [Roseofilum reptotaenium AO1-A]